MLTYSEFLVYEQDELLYGFIGITDKSYFEGLFVLKQFQGHGIGTKLLEECKKRYQILTFDVFTKNKQAINFYQKHDFKITYEKENSNTKGLEYVMQW